MIQKLFLVVFLFMVGVSTAQKKTLTHNDYDAWKDITKTQVSANGKLVVVTVKTGTGRGDGYIQIYNTETQKKANYFNGNNAFTTYDEKFVIFTKKIKYETTRLEKKAEKKDENKEKEVLYIYDVEKNTLYDSIKRVKRYKASKKNSNYLVVEKFKNKKDSIKGDSLPAWQNNYAVVYDLKSKQQDTIFHIKDIVLPEEGHTFYYSNKSQRRKKKAKGVYAYNTSIKSVKVIDTSRFDYKKLSVNKRGNQFAFIAYRDSVETDSVPFKLYLYKDEQLKLLVENEENYLSSKETLSGTKQPYFSENSDRLYFYSKIKSLYKKDTTLLTDEIPNVDVWSWNDGVLQSRQKANESLYKEDVRLRCYNVKDESYVKLQDDDLYFIYLADKQAKKYVLGLSDKPYEIENGWNRPVRNDYYAISLETGKKKLAVKAAGSSVFMGENGDYAFYFDMDQQHWFSVDLNTLQKRNLTSNINVSFADEDDDNPMLKYAYGNGGFDKDGNLLLYDKYDIWKVALDGSIKPKNITKKGRRKKIRFRTQKQKENNWLAEYVDEKLLLFGFHEKTKSNAIYLLNGGKLIEKVKPNHQLLSNVVKAEKEDVLVFKKESFTKYGDSYLTTDNFKTDTQLTNVNPQQKEFKWGTAELTSWKAYDGTKLEGIIYKPEDFDPSKKYPLIVYFYEKSSEGLYKYQMPRPSPSTIDEAYLVSNDYIVFTPDIVYKTGQPGDDAYNCVVSGTEMMEKKGYIDSSRMAIQGQSWGGYQVAYLVTKTNKYKAAMAGAPVSNMTSAYGGIRWRSGFSRMFQYERTQSRIGKNLWDGFDLYVKNSPLFSLPNVETPLLMMHNDNDGAVPYYQGIELYMGMRRLQKPAWLLVYNNESHNLRKMKNRQDLSIRMMQFFDHYLKDVPAPIWMTKGIPRRQKGINLGYDLDEN